MKGLPDLAAHLKSQVWIVPVGSKIPSRVAHQRTHECQLLGSRKRFGYAVASGAAVVGGIKRARIGDHVCRTTADLHSNMRLTVLAVFHIMTSHGPNDVCGEAGPGFLREPRGERGPFFASIATRRSRRSHQPCGWRPVALDTGRSAEGWR